MSEPKGSPKAERVCSIVEKVGGRKLHGARRADMLQFIEEQAHECDFDTVPDWMLEAVISEMMTGMKAQLN